jgi:hypothetical protein
LPSRFYFFSHLISASIAGFVGSLIIYIWLTVRGLKQHGKIVALIV